MDKVGRMDMFSKVSKTSQVDEILIPNADRFVLFPIKYPDLYELYQKAVSAFWTAGEINLTSDLHDWEKVLTNDERNYVKIVLAFFAGSDGIVTENLAQRFANEVQYPEARIFYYFQLAIESIHMEVYSLFIDTYIKDHAERNALFRSIETIPVVKKKADWALRWIETTDASFGERLLAFAAVEGIFFSGSFAAIFWLRKRGLLPGLTFANKKISADEGLHMTFACRLYRAHIRNSKPSVARAHQIIREATDLEKEFHTEALPVRLIGLNAERMSEYIEYVADFLCSECGLPKIYGRTVCPLDFVESTSLSSNVNFFEDRNDSYFKALGKREYAETAEF